MLCHFVIHVIQTFIGLSLLCLDLRILVLVSVHLFVFQSGHLPGCCGEALDVGIFGVTAAAHGATHVGVLVWFFSHIAMIWARL